MFKMTNINTKMLELGEKSSVIRELFEYGKKRKSEIGAENVYDFSLGNPSVPAPAEVNEAIEKLMAEKTSVDLHGYTSGPGDMDVRKCIADYLNKTHGTNMTFANIYMTCGAAASLTSSIHAISNPGDEIIAFAPFFPEYRVFVEKSGAELVPVPCKESDLAIDTVLFEKAITEKTKAVIINSPNNPTGVVISEKILRELCAILKKYSEKYGHVIYLISDEPYRELVYDDEITVPFVTNYYDNSIVCYSFSKSLSIPGERIGYIAVSEKAEDWKKVFAAVCGAGRSLGFVCAPSMFQKIIPSCIGKVSDLSIYKKNRDIFVKALREYGYTLPNPDGAFYLFVKALEKDARAFSERAKKYELLIVPSDSFSYPGYVRLAYCVDTDMIIKSLPAFKALAEEYKKS